MVRLTNTTMSHRTEKKKERVTREFLEKVKDKTPSEASFLALSTLLAVVLEIEELLQPEIIGVAKEEVKECTELHHRDAFCKDCYTFKEGNFPNGTVESPTPSIPEKLELLVTNENDPTQYKALKPMKIVDTINEIIDYLEKKEKLSNITRPIGHIN